MTEFTFQLLFLFLPGLMAFIVVDTLTTHKPINNVWVFLYVVLLGWVCYVANYLVQVIWFWCAEVPFAFVHMLTNKEQALNLSDILGACILSLPTGLIISWIINHHWLNRIAQFFRITRKHPNTDVWNQLMNQRGSDVEWVVIRDQDKDLMYRGWVAFFADSTDDFDEILLTGAEVYRNSTGIFLYNVPGLYLSMKHGSKVVEFPKLKLKK